MIMHSIEDHSDDEIQAPADRQQGEAANGRATNEKNTNEKKAKGQTCVDIYTLTHAHEQAGKEAHTS